MLVTVFLQYLPFKKYAQDLKDYTGNSFNKLFLQWLQIIITITSYSYDKY